MRGLWLVFVFAGLAAAQQAEPPTGAITGRVLAGYEGPPVRGAAVTVTRIDKELGLAWSGQDGRYNIEGLAPGRYSVNVTKPAFGNYGRPVEVRAGETTRNVDIPITLRGLLAGRVAASDDLPVEGATVSLHRLGETYGRPAAFAAGEDETDDRGEFRVSRLASGRYFAVLQPAFRPDVAGTYRLLHPPLFYPNAVNPAEAQPVSIGPGLKIETLDFETPAPAATAMTILTRAGVPGKQARSCARCRFSLQVRHAQAWLEVLKGQSNAQGLIDIYGVYPGTYRIAILESSARDLYAGYDLVTAEEGRNRRYEVTAWAANSLPVKVTLVNPPEALRREDATWRAALTATALDPRYPGVSRMEPARIEGHGPSGQGRLWLVPGQWALSLFKSAPLPENAYIEAVLWGDRRQSGPFVGVDQRGYSARIEVRIGFAAATISGTISNLDAKATVRPLVRAIAEPADGYGLDTSLPVGASGDFHSNNLPPGTYVVYALSPRGRESDLYDPAVQARYANYAKRISLAPGETVRVELEAIP